MDFDWAEIASAMPPGFAERMARMDALGHQLVLAFIDGDREQVADTVGQIAAYDDAPGRPPYPGPRFAFALRQVVTTTNILFEQADSTGVLLNSALADGARDLIVQFAPEQYRDSALEQFAAVPGDDSPMNLGIEGKEADAGSLLAAAACTAWLGTQRSIVPVLQDVRNVLGQRIRTHNADAHAVPGTERVVLASDQEARAFIDQLFPPAGSYPFPTDPGEWTTGEREVIGMLKEHLLTMPASATTPHQVQQLKRKIVNILEAALARLETSGAGRTSPPSRSGIQQRKDKPKRPKRHKPRRGKK